MGSLESRKVRTIMDDDWMAVLGGKGKEGQKVSPCIVSRKCIINAITLVKLPWEGRGLKDLGNSGRNHSGGWSDRRSDGG